MDINKLEQALAILNKDADGGSFFAYHDELQIFPMADKFSPEEMKQLEDLGFRPCDDDGFMCFT
jgi:hypothetical protein